MAATTSEADALDFWLGDRLRPAGHPLLTAADPERVSVRGEVLGGGRAPYEGRSARARRRGNIGGLQLWRVRVPREPRAASR